MIKDRNFNFQLNAKSSGATLIFLVLLFFSFIMNTGCFVISLGPDQGAYEEKIVQGVGEETENKILVIEIDGIINEKAEKGFLKVQQSKLTLLKEKLRKAAGDEFLKGVILRINSPGGSATVSDIMYKEVQKFKEEKNVPVVACLMDVAASGGYYIAAAADKIIAHPTTITGSIGVIMMAMNIEGLFEKIGVNMQVIKAGDKKDLGSPFRKMTEEEQEILQKMVDEIYERFIEVIKAGRPGLEEPAIGGLADGSIYVAKDAKEKGLVDEIGYFSDAVELTLMEAGLDHANVIVYQRPGEYRENVYSHPYDQAPGGSPFVKYSKNELEEFLGVKTGIPLYLWIP